MFGLRYYLAGTRPNATFLGEDFGSGQGTETNNFLTGLFTSFFGQQVDPLNPQNSPPDIAVLLASYESDLQHGVYFETIVDDAVSQPEAGTFLANQYYSLFLGPLQQPNPNEVVAIPFPLDPEPAGFALHGLPFTLTFSRISAFIGRFGDVVRVGLTRVPDRDLLLPGEALNRPAG
jgi:hypothetical protein